MNTFTHWKLARLSAGAMGRMHPGYKMGRLETLLFCLGSIQPDFSIMHWIHPHYYESSAGYVYSKIMRRNRNGQLAEAYGLGQSVHYLCDFCCFAHTENFSGRILSHIAYERNINEYLNANYERLDRRKIKQQEHGDLLVRIDGIIEERKLHGSSCRKDIEKSMEVTLALTEHVFLSRPAAVPEERIAGGRIDPALI